MQLLPSLTRTVHQPIGVVSETVPPEARVYFSSSNSRRKSKMS